jgi:hypothetical protein
MTASESMTNKVVVENYRLMSYGTVKFSKEQGMKQYSDRTRAC